LFGCKPEVEDYKISAIGREEFDDELKEKLRELKRCQFMWSDMAEAVRGMQSIQRRKEKKNSEIKNKMATFA